MLSTHCLRSAYECAALILVVSACEFVRAGGAEMSTVVRACDVHAFVTCVSGLHLVGIPHSLGALSD